MTDQEPEEIRRYTLEELIQNYSEQSLIGQLARDLKKSEGYNQVFSEGVCDYHEGYIKAHRKIRELKQNIARLGKALEYSAHVIFGEGFSGDEALRLAREAMTEDVKKIMEETKA